MHRSNRILPGLVVCLLLGTSHVANADTITWNLTGSGSEGSVGNSRVFTAGGITVTATAWSIGTLSSSTFQAARLGIWSTGLGVCNTGETCRSPYHQVDNGGTPDDFVLFQFSAPVDPLSVRIDPYGTYDRDVSYWVGNINTSNLTGLSYNGLATLGFGLRIDNDDYASSSYRDVSIGGANSVNALLFGARVGSGADSNADYFKIKSMTASTSVPEPSSMFLLALGMGVIGLVSMRWNPAKI